METVLARLAPLEAQLAELQARDPKPALDGFAARLEALQSRLGALETPGENPFAEISAQLTRLYSQKDAATETVFARLAPLEARLAELQALAPQVAALAEADPREALDDFAVRLETLHWTQGEVAAGLAALRASLGAGLGEGGVAAPFTAIAEQLTRLYAEKDATLAAVEARLAPLEARLAEMGAQGDAGAAAEEAARAEARAIAGQLAELRAAAAQTELFADRLAVLEASLPRLNAAQSQMMRALERQAAVPRCRRRPRPCLPPRSRPIPRRRPPPPRPTPSRRSAICPASSPCITSDAGNPGLTSSSDVKRQPSRSHAPRPDEVPAPMDTQTVDTQGPPSAPPALADLIGAGLVSHEMIGDPAQLGPEAEALAVLCAQVGGPVWRLDPFHYAFRARPEDLGGALAGIAPEGWTAALEAALRAELGAEAVWISGTEVPPAAAGLPDLPILLLRAQGAALAEGLTAAGPGTQAVIQARFAVEAARLAAGAEPGSALARRLAVIETRQEEILEMLVERAAGAAAEAATLGRLAATLAATAQRLDAQVAALAARAAESGRPPDADAEAFRADLALTLAEFLARLEQAEGRGAPLPAPALPRLG